MPPLSTPTLSIVMPTLGRSTLIDAINALRAQMSAHDELILVGQFPFSIADDYRIRLIKHPNTPHHGYDKLDVGYAAARNDYILMRGDADEFPTHSLTTIRAALTSLPAPHLFAMCLGDLRAGAQNVRTRQIIRGLVGAQMLVLPNTPERMPRWFRADGTDTYENDYEFIRDACAHYGTIHFHDDIVVTKRVWNCGRMF